MQKYIEALRNTGEYLEAKFNKSKIVAHSASKGSIREAIVDEIIRPFLPNIYGLSGGECFSSNNEVSKQLDLIIYDELYSYKIPFCNNFIQFPCESVYGNIEVKSFLDKNEFIKSIDNIASLKKLKREPTTIMDVTPFWNVEFEGFDISDTRCKNEYIGIVFAYDSPNIKTVMEYFNQINEKEEYLPNVFVIYKQHTIICRYKQDATSTHLGFDIKDLDGFVAVDTGIDTLPVFISELLSMLQISRLKSANITEIGNKLLSQKLKEQRSGIACTKKFNQQIQEDNKCQP